MSRVRTIDQPNTSQKAISALALTALLAAAVLALAPLTDAGAQSVRAGSGRTSLNVSASVSIPIRLKAEQAGAALIVGEDAKFTTVDVPVRVAANMLWSLQVSASQTEQPLQVLDARGTWVSLDATQPVRVLDRRAATNPALFNVRLRVPAGVDVASLEDLRLRLTPAGT